MESGIQSSFIPRDAGHPTASRGGAGSGGLSDMLLVVAIVLFATSCALAGAVFLYQQYLNTQVSSDAQQIQRAESSFQPSLVEELTRLDDRMTTAQGLLDSHIAPSAFFSALDQVTLQTVSFTSLDFDATDPSQIQATFEGVAQDVNAIALEDQLLTQSGVFSDPIFSNIDREQDGVHFDLTVLVNPSAINYSQLAGASGNSTSAPTTETVGASTTIQTAPSATTTAPSTQSAPSSSGSQSSSNQQILQQAQQSSQSSNGGFGQ